MKKKDNCQLPEVTRYARGRESGGRARTRHEEIGGGLSVRGLVAHIDEILSRATGRSEVGHSALVDHTHFVEELVQGLAGLVDGDNRRHPAKLGRDPEGSDELEGCRRAGSGVRS